MLCKKAVKFSKKGVEKLMDLTADALVKELPGNGPAGQKIYSYLENALNIHNQMEDSIAKQKTQELANFVNEYVLPNYKNQRKTRFVNDLFTNHVIPDLKRKKVQKMGDFLSNRFWEKAKKFPKDILTDHPIKILFLVLSIIVFIFFKKEFLYFLIYTRKKSWNILVQVLQSSADFYKRDCREFRLYIDKNVPEKPIRCVWSDR